MNLSSPISSIAPGGRGAVLAVLARTEHPLSGRRIAELADEVGKTRVNDLLTELVQAGIVLAESQPPAVLYQLNRRHLAAPAIEALAGLRDQLIAALRETIAAWSVPVASAWLFGSVARGDGGVDSDIDIALVRHDRIDIDDLGWHTQMVTLIELVQDWTGNEASVIEYAESELRRLADDGEGIVTSIGAEGIHLGGRRTLLSPKARAR